MPVLTIQQTLKYASDAGFTGDGLARIVAIAMCESGLNTHPPDNINTDSMRSRDRGLYQINSYWHSEVSDSCAYDPVCASQAVYRISNRGTIFTEWSTYRNGCSDTKISQVRQSMSTNFTNVPLPTATTKSIPDWTKPFMNVSIQVAESTFNHYPTSGEGWAEGGVDWTPSPNNLPITALLPGTIVGAGYFCKDGSVTQFFRSTWQGCQGAQGFGVVTIRSTNPRPDIVPGSQIDIYYQHIIIDPSIKLSNSGGVGQQVIAGQQIGTANGQFNVEVGVNIGTSWGGIWGSKSPGPHVDPIPFLHTLIAGGIPTGGVASGITGGVGGVVSTVSTTITTVQEQAHSLITTIPGFLGICEALDIAEQFIPFQLPTSDSSLIAQATQNTDINIFGWDTGATNPFAVAGKVNAISQLPSDAIQAVLVFTVTNFAAFAIRAMFVLAGGLLLWALLINLASQYIDVEDIAKVAAMA